MAFKALLSIVTLAAALQVADGAAALPLLLARGAISNVFIFAVCSCAHPSRRVPRREEHRDERGVLPALRDRR